MVVKSKRRWDWDWHGTARRKTTAEARARKWRERGYEAKIEYNRVSDLWFVYIRRS